MAKHRVYRMPALAAMSMAAVTTISAGLLMSGSAGAADTTDPACPNGYLPAVGQDDPASTLCITAGPSRNGDIHALVRVDPLLCAHLAVGDHRRSDGTVPRDVVRTLRCPRMVPVTVVPTAPATPPDTAAPGSNNTSNPLPPAPAPVTVGSNLPVTH
jgi:hypothetical protein